MAKKITTEIFKERAQKLFPNYDYSKSVYVNAKTKVIIICPEHGEFLVTPNKVQITPSSFDLNPIQIVEV